LSSCIDIADAQVIKLNPSSHTGYKLKHAVLHEVKRYDEAIEAFKIMLSKLDNASDPQIRGKHRVICVNIAAL
jgi:hypothetical protein